MADELATLVNRCLDGDQPSFHELVDRFRGRVFGLCFRMLGHRQDAEDVTQETMVRLVRNLHRWDPTRPFEPWLMTIAGNRCRSHMAKRMRRPKSVTLEQPIPNREVEASQAKLLAEEIDLAIDHLRDEYRQVFLLFHKHELEYAEIARRMDVPLGTIKTWVHRARREIVAQLARRGVVRDPQNPHAHV